MKARYRHALPQLSGKLFLTDGGIETTMVFLEGIQLPYFAAFDLMPKPEGRAKLEEYFRRYASIARAHEAGFVFESPTWRASRDWAERLGYSPAELADVNRSSIELMAALRSELETATSPMVLSGCIGPRGDGYKPDQMMSAATAEAYHSEQVGAFRETEADMIAAITMNYVEEAIGIARAAKAAGMPSALAFTVETDGRLPTGQSLKEAIEAVDLATGHAPAYYMINCAHPTHFEAVLESGEPWTKRIRGIRANASHLSHAELDAATELDDGNPSEFGQQYRQLQRKLPQLNVLGGCCGTDHRHVEAIARACTHKPYKAAFAA
jgi:S-methylmethionine-dependent homocysteine/selenocysteine methylase